MRRIFGLFGMILIVWLSMLVGLAFIFGIVLPFNIPSKDWFSQFLTSVFQVGVSALLALLWLWMWKKLENLYFWRTVNKPNGE